MCICLKNGSNYVQSYYNVYLLGKIGFSTAENEPSKVMFSYFILPQNFFTHQKYNASGSSLDGPPASRSHSTRSHQCNSPRGLALLQNAFRDLVTMFPQNFAAHVHNRIQLRNAVSTSISHSTLKTCLFTVVSAVFVFFSLLRADR